MSSPLDHAREDWWAAAQEHAEAVASGDVEWAADARRVRGRLVQEFRAARRAARGDGPGRGRS